MIGDKLVITDYHRAAGRRIREHVGSLARSVPVAISVSGESGSGKSETAQCLAELFEAEGLRCIVLAQDDYFRLPPRSNHERRLEDFSWVGPAEVRLDLLDEHVVGLKSGRGITKPLVYFDENRIGEEVLRAGHRDVVIVEGTYTAMLGNVDVRAFIDRNYRQTKKVRLARARDPDTEFIEKVLHREHTIISQHRALADVIVDPPPGEAPDHSS